MTRCWCVAPYHFRDYGAVLGSIDPVTVEGLDFYSGIFPARHGDRLSAVMDLHPREAKGEDHHEIGISLLALHALSVGEREVAGAPTRWLVASSLPRRSSGPAATVAVPVSP